MNKLYILLILFVAGIGTVQAQNNNTERADKLYSEKQYVDAAEAYEKALKKGEQSAYVYEQLGNAYFYTRDFDKASTYYKRAMNKMESSEMEPEMLYRYANALKARERYDEAMEVMEKFAAKAPGDSRARKFRSNPNYIQDIQNMQKQYEIEAADFNSDLSDFAAISKGDELYFSSARNTSRRKYQWNKEPYLDIYKSVMNSQTEEMSAPKLLEGDVNTKYHEGTLDITPDGKYMFFTRVNYFKGNYEKSSEGVGKLNIYRATKRGGEWTDIQATSINDDEYSVGHPSISKDGSTIYFASAQPGGKGGSDLYMASLTDGTIGEPRPLSNLNTAGDDSFPFIADDGTLYFTSTGHLGLGGQDVFMAEASGTGFGEAQNMGTPVNSSFDDFAFSFNPETGKGFVSSNRKGGAGGDDIYHVTRIEKQEVDVTILVVDGETGEPVEGAIVSLGDNMGMSYPNQTTDDEGKVKYTTDAEKDFTVRVASLEGYESGEAEISVGSQDEKTFEIRLEPEEVPEPVTLKEIKFEFDESDITPEAATELDRLVQIMKERPEIRIKAETHADIRGSAKYNMELTKRRAKSVVEYITSKGIDKGRIFAEPRGEQDPVHDCSDGCTEEEYQASRRSEFYVISGEGVMSTEPIDLEERN